MLFSQEMNGYNRQEVDAHIKRLQATFEARLMEEKLKALESERRMLDLKNERTEIENKEKNILNALSVIEKAKKFQEEGNRNFYKLLMDKLEILVNELSEKFPQLRMDHNFDTLLAEFSQMVHTYKQNLDQTNDITRPIYSDNDSMRLLLNKMQDYKKGNAPKEVHIKVQRTTLEDFGPAQNAQTASASQNINANAAEKAEQYKNIKTPTQSQNFSAAQAAQSQNIQGSQNQFAQPKNSQTAQGSAQYQNTISQSQKTLAQQQNSQTAQYPNAIGQQQNTQTAQNTIAQKTSLTKATPNYSLERKNITFVYPDQNPQPQTPSAAPQTPAPTFYGTSESGFNLEEALHPTDDLAEIMKAFDFFNDN